MASIDSTITIELCKEDRQLIKRVVSLLETLDDGGHFKALAKEVISLHDKYGDKKEHAPVID